MTHPNPANTAKSGPRDVHLVGSVPLSSTAEVFSLVGGLLGPRLPRIPDGETGPRNYWVTSQARVIHFDPAFEPAGHNWDPDSGTVPETGAPKYRLRAGVDPSTLELPSFGYADAALASYREFLDRRRAGEIDPRTRFQVSLPTPLAFFTGIIADDSQEAVAHAFEKRILGEAKDIVAAIPAEDLAIQWDVCLEIFIWEGIKQVYFDNPRQGCLDRLVPLIDVVPEPVQVGYHLCYGDFRHKHGVEPKDTANMVTIANHLAAHASRQIDWVHMPVPRDRDDDAYFRPLRELKLHPRTQLFLGLVHYTDGEDGTRRRMAAADKYVADYGIATECGLGRRDPATIPDLLRIHARCADAAPAGATAG